MDNKIYADWYERLSKLEYNYTPEKDGDPWYRAHDVWACIDETYGPAQEKTKPCSDLNYEEEWRRLVANHNQLRDEHMKLNRDFDSLQAAYDRLSAQMEIVHLIFGKR